MRIWSSVSLLKEVRLEAPVEKESVTVCLLDDDVSMLKSIGRLLSSEGWRVKEFLDPNEFLSYAGEAKPRLVVIDIYMPVMDGLEVQRRLRMISPLTRVIILTSKDDPITRSQAFAAGALAFFLKPASQDDFLAGVEAAAI